MNTENLIRNNRLYIIWNSGALTTYGDTRKTMQKKDLTTGKMKTIKLTNMGHRKAIDSFKCSSIESAKKVIYKRNKENILEAFFNDNKGKRFTMGKITKN